MKAGTAIVELLIDFTAIAVSMVVSLVIPSILPKIPAELVASLWVGPPVWSRSRWRI
jgi:hypothetical protein